VEIGFCQTQILMNDRHCEDAGLSHWAKPLRLCRSGLRGANSIITYLLSFFSFVLIQKRKKQMFLPLSFIRDLFIYKVLMRELLVQKKVPKKKTPRTPTAKI
jgi:hypothetical protein